MGAAVLILAGALPACAQQCVRPGAWVAPQATGPVSLTAKEVLDRASSRTVVLLGELHDRPDHHRWQLNVLAAVQAWKGDIAIGFEMFPRRVQPVLDRWVAGELTEAQFLEQSDWANVWGFETSLYLPLFHFARMHRIPMVALNVERTLIREVSTKGANAVPQSMREGVGQPEAPPPDYVTDLHAVFTEHGEAKKGIAPSDPTFLRFVESQTLWDRAMAEAIRDAQRRLSGRQVFAVMGRGHTVPGAVPHQLNALGLRDAMVLLPWERDEDCAKLKVGMADAVFGLEPYQPSKTEQQRPRLGIVLGAIDGGVRIDQVIDGSLAAQTGLKAGDVLLMMAGRKMEAVADVVGTVGRQAPGTWLPLRIRRDGSEIDFVAKFPPAPR